MAFRHPGRAEAEAIGQLDLLEEVLEHDALGRHVAVHHGLADREEDIELHRAYINRSMRKLALVLLVACTTAIPANRYGLHVVPDLRTFERLVREDPSKRLVNITGLVY